MAATDETRQIPWLLLLLVIILVVDLLVLLGRVIWRWRRRSRRDAPADPQDNPFMDDPGEFDPDGDIEAGLAADHREAQLVS